MDFKTSIEYFTKIKEIELYEGKKLEEIYPDSSLINTRMGEVIEISWKNENFHCILDFPILKKRIMRNLKIIPRIGPNIEKRFKKRGVSTLFDLKHSVIFSTKINKTLDLIECNDYNKLMQIKNVYDLDVLFCFQKEDLLFIDIETLGLYNDPIIEVGFGFFEGTTFHIRAIFARNLDEEITLLEHLKNEIFPRFKCLVTYNGKSFDIPYLMKRFLYFFEENPFNEDTELRGDKLNSRFHHVDLYHNCRRIYKNQFTKYTLSQVEAELLGFMRPNELPGSLIADCYKLYQLDSRKYVGLIKKIIEHNYWDVYSMPLILQTLLKN